MYFQILIVRNMIRLTFNLNLINDTIQCYVIYTYSMLCYIYLSFSIKLVCDSIVITGTDVFSFFHLLQIESDINYVSSKFRYSILLPGIMYACVYM